MFFIVFVLLFSKALPTNAIKCMTNEKSSMLNMISTNKCSFQLNIGVALYTDDQIEGTNNCATRDAGFGLSSGSCYAEVAIDYTKKEMLFRFNHVNVKDSFKDPYDDMFGFFTTAESVIQYKISGNLEKNTFEMITRVQCKTSDNCALNKIRELLANLTIVDSRQTIFNELNSLLNQPGTNLSEPLTCISPTGVEDQCPDGKDRCEFTIKKNEPIMSCTKASGTNSVDIEYRGNIVEKLKDDELELKQYEAFKCHYICRTDLCNSLDNFARADNLLYALAMGSVDEAKSQVKPNPVIAYRRTSIADSLHISIYERFTMIFLLIILLSSN